MTDEWTSATADSPRPDWAIGPSLRDQREQQGVTLRELGRRAGLSASTLSQIETGKMPLSVSRAMALADALEIDPRRLHPDLTDSSVRRTSPPGGDPREWRIFPPIELDVALGAALQCFTRTGYHGTSMRHIAREAGLSVPGLYHHQPSKVAMLRALLDVGMSDLLSRSRSALDEGRDTRERFALLIEALALFNAHRPQLAFLGTSELRALPDDDRQRHAEIRNEQQRLVGDQVEMGVDEGIFATGEPHAAARAVVTMCAGIASWYRPGGTFTPAQIAAQYVEFSLGAVRAAARPQAGRAK